MRCTDALLVSLHHAFESPMLWVMDFYHVLFRFATSRFMDAAVRPRDLLEAFRRDLDLYGI
jgi:hypothetical protein